MQELAMELHYLSYEGGRGEEEHAQRLKLEQGAPVHRFIRAY